MVRYGCVLGLGAARPIEPVIEANGDRVEIGANADRRNGVEIVVPAAEVIEIALPQRCTPAAAKPIKLLISRLKIDQPAKL
jgi:hypothetical protein